MALRKRVDTNPFGPVSMKTRFLTFPSFGYLYDMLKLDSDNFYKVPENELPRNGREAYSRKPVRETDFIIYMEPSELSGAFIGPDPRYHDFSLVYRFQGEKSRDKNASPGMGERVITIPNPVPFNMPNYITAVDSRQSNNSTCLPILGKLASMIIIGSSSGNVYGLMVLNPFVLREKPGPDEDPFKENDTEHRLYFHWYASDNTFQMVPLSNESDIFVPAMKKEYHHLGLSHTRFVATILIPDPRDPDDFAFLHGKKSLAQIAGGFHVDRIRYIYEQIWNDSVVRKLYDDVEKDLARCYRLYKLVLEAKQIWLQKPFEGTRDDVNDFKWIVKKQRELEKKQVRTIENLRTLYYITSKFDRFA